MTLFSSLTNRIFLATALLVVLATAVGVYSINVAVTRQAYNELRRGLEEAGTILEEHRTTLFEHLAREARLVADLSNLKAAIDTRHPPTVQPLAEGFQKRIGADLLVVTDDTGRWLAEAGRIQVETGDPVVVRTIEDGLRGREAVALWPRPRGVVQVVCVPSFVASDLLGTVSVGFSLDEETAARFKALTNSEIAFAFGRRILASTLEARFHPTLAGLIGTSDIREFWLDDTEYVAVARPMLLSTAAGSEPALAPAQGLSALILRSKTERLRFLTVIHRQLAGTAVLAVLLATLLSYAIARTVTRPLGAITATMREMAATGDLTRRLPDTAGSRWEDEDARLLARTFNAMTDSIARFQREAAQRERLSSLGRLSTVVAHEIRNPLMIIKTALRGLKAPAPAPEAVTAAVADIEEEVARLNRIVSEVLDFARPIKFELAAVDVNDVCRDAARAVESDTPDISVRLDLDPAALQAVTDAERLRQALVNILTNARHAVAARRDGAAIPDPIRLRTRRSDARVAIDVRDRGTGIAADDLPRVFDPYFTTRRTGTGLGLAISRNIIEGLGGTIRVSSRPGDGTEVRIELPATSDRART
ncbi:MAG TPA: ATP-binding protein [Vicinamibacterales bacterium]|nr:ATP-binding protein [Vicinamibacterales bacterium]